MKGGRPTLEDHASGWSRILYQNTPQLARVNWNTQLIVDNKERGTKSWHDLNFRRRKGTDTWHFCTNCSNWPTHDYDVSNRPTTGEYCNECLAKEKAGNCS